MANNMVTPIIKGPITDIFSAVGNFQNHQECWKRELELVDCLEAYGPLHGQTKCHDLMADLRECVIKGKQRQRFLIMRRERLRQIADGERDPENAFIESPPADSY
uniref:Uncharacterized protein n=1 Tax=Bracon brevicornis TaxID=1563983 RepID=A0A6V7IQM7_9HYME